MENKKITQIVLTFENIEQIVIPAEDIASFYFGNITGTIFKGWHSEAVLKSKVAHNITLVLNPAANKLAPDLYNAETVFDRITKYRDISSIDIYYDDGEIEELSTDFVGTFSNKNQTCRRVDDGHLLIVISKDEIAEDVEKLMF